MCSETPVYMLRVMCYFIHHTITTQPNTQIIVTVRPACPGGSVTSAGVNSGLAFGLESINPCAPAL